MCVASANGGGSLQSPPEALAHDEFGRDGYTDALSAADNTLQPWRSGHWSDTTAHGRARLRTSNGVEQLQDGRQRNDAPQCGTVRA